jgi:hypothetical protein
MSSLSAFFRQPSHAYRNFHLVFTLLTLNFVIPAFSYSLSPDTAIAQYLQANAALGGIPYPFDESQSHLWRYLAAANVMTLGFMCLLLQVSLRRFYVVVVPLLFLKGYATLSWLCGFVAAPTIRVFLGAALLDGVTCLAIYFFASRAWRDIRERQDAVLVPRPWTGVGPSHR